MLKETVCLLALLALLEPVRSRGCSSFFCRKSYRVSSGAYGGPDPGKPLFLTPYLEDGRIDEGEWDLCGGLKWRPQLSPVNNLLCVFSVL